jgi:hypothetical protein
MAKPCDGMVLRQLRNKLHVTGGPVVPGGTTGGSRRGAEAQHHQQ